MAPSNLLAAALFTAAHANSDLDESSMLQMPVGNQQLETDEDECRCPGYYQDECEAEAAQGCIWSAAGESNEPWCQCGPVPTPVCCEAMTSSCLACQAGMSEDAYCASNPGQHGCPDNVYDCEICRQLAEAKGLEMGGVGWSFEGNQGYAPGCYTYISGQYTCHAYCGTGATLTEIAEPLARSDRARLDGDFTVPEQCVGDDTPVCCEAMTASCLSCQQGISEVEYCASNPGQNDCPPVGPPCPDPAFPYHIASGAPFCYTDATYAAANAGPCENWCTTDPTNPLNAASGHCFDDVAEKVCSGPPVDPACPDPAFPYHIASDTPFCYTDASYAVASAGPCENWCTTDPTHPLNAASGHCFNDVAEKVCGGVSVLTFSEAGRDNWCGQSNSDQYAESSSSRSGWALDTSSNGGWRWCGISAAECQQECTALGECEEIYWTPNNCCFPSRSACHTGNTAPGGQNGQRYIAFDPLSVAHFTEQGHDNWCGQSNRNHYEQTSSSRSGWAFDNQANGGWRWCGISVEECQTECNDLGACQEIYWTPNNCCFPSRSSCDNGNTAPGGHGGRRFIAQ